MEVTSCSLIVGFRLLASEGKGESRDDGMCVWRIISIGGNIYEEGEGS